MESRRSIDVSCLLTLVAVLAAGPVWAVPLCGSSGDGNGDCRVSLVDHADLAACLSGPGVPAAPECQCYDMNGDGHVDLLDDAIFQREFTGDSLISGCVLPVRLEEPGTLSPEKSGSPDEPYWEIPDSGVNDSVYLFSGEFHLRETDLVIRGRGYDFQWARCYRSRTGPDTAMGRGWDHCYNIRLESSGANLVLHDGDGRSDEYCANPSGTWTHPEFFREITQTPVGDYEMTAHDRAVWRFNGFTGLPDEGRISSMSDRYGNTCTFAYDATGRLTTIRDTLDSAVNPRAITIAYNADGLIQSVTDFTGRQVTYTYYHNPDVGGDDGDLRTVTSPPVVGTPNGNDFPLGKTTTYSYSEGQPDPRLNHNLLTVTDPKGQVYLRNTYAPTLNPADLEFDRCMSQQRGLPNELCFFHYLTLSPAPANNFSTSMCIVNDRVGNVEECLYDYRNRCAMIRRYTGRANPLAPTTTAINRPVNPLRPGDPPFYEMRFQYNDESLLTRAIAPEHDDVTIVYEGDDDFFAPQRRRAEPKRRTCRPGPRGAAQPDIRELFEFDPLRNSDTGQMTLHVDGRGNPTTYDYDASGNLTRAVRAIPSVIDEFAYNAFGQLTLRRAPDNGSGHLKETEFHYYPQAAGPPYGYLQQIIEDPPGFALTTTYEYDSVGNMTRMIDPRGNDSLYDYNQLDQVVRARSPEVVPAVGPRYETLTYYDANDNTVRIDVENRDANGVLGANTHFTTEYQYDILNNVTRTIEEVDAASSVVTEYEYDANRNPTVTRLGEATNGNQPTNTVTHEYDERDLLFHTTRAATDPNESTTQYDYDGDGNLTRTTQGLQGLVPRVDTFEYDGYNRLTISGDSFGNESQFDYDANGNVVRDAVFGELVDIPGAGGNVRLSETLYAYDPINRLTIHGAQFFDSAQNPLTDGESTTTVVYSDSSHVLQVIDDNGHTSSCTYDTANRRQVCSDAKGNSVRYTYDANSNVIAEDATDKSDLGLADQSFTDTYAYDGLNRITIYGDNFGNTRSSSYNSRGLVEEDLDALGNRTTYAYDGMNRLTITGQELTANGAGGGPVVGTTVSTQVWDDSSRLIEQGDSLGHVTVTGHDPLNRPAYRNFADGTGEQYLYDVHDNLTVYVDANGTQINYSYDALNRLSGKAVTPGPAVSNDTTFETYTYDGLDRIVSALDDDSLVFREYDSLSNIVSELQNGQMISSAYDGLGNETQCVYPNGRTIDRAYDAIDRLQAIDEGPTPVAAFAYVGDRMQYRTLGNGTRTQIEYDGVSGVPNRPGDFGVRLPSLIVHDNPSAGTTIDVRSFIWDPEYNRRVRSNPLTALEHDYEYDSVYRLTRTVVNDISPPAPTVVRDTQYTLDLVGNRNLVLNDNCPGAYTLDPASPPSDAQMNQYTTTGCDGRSYDENGNWTQQSSGVPVARMTYDYKDRLIQHDDFASGTATVMAYDPFDRRIRQEISAGVPVSQTDYLYDGPDLVMEQDGGGTVTTYVYGEGIDEIISMRRGPDEFYYHCDDLNNVLALTDTNGVVVERYDYQDYGQPEFYDAGGNPILSSAVGNPLLFTGRRYDSTTGLYNFRRRYLDPVAGRFTTRDPMCMWDSKSKSGNAYDYAGGNPWTNTDPLGLMNKAELIDAIASGSGLSKADSKRALEGFMSSTSSALKKGDKISLVGFGSFSVSKRAARTGRNPQTGKEIKIAAKNVVKFKAGSELSKKVNIAPGGGGGSGGGGSGSDVDSAWETCSGGALRVEDMRRGHPHHGHVTVLKIAAGGGGPPHCPGCGALLCRCTDAPMRGPGETGTPFTHVFVRSAGGGGGGGLLGNKLFVGGLSWDSSGGGNNGGGGNHGPGKHKHKGHVTILKIANPGGGGGGGGANRGPGKHKHKGHVTILKIANPGGGGWPDATPQNYNFSVVAPPPGGGGGRVPGDKKHKHRGHVTILK